MTNPDSTPIYVGEGLGAAGAWLNGQAGLAADELATLRSMLAPLAEAWAESKAADYYTVMQLEWENAADNLLGPDGILGQIAAVMQVNWNNYVETEHANMKTWQH